MGGIVKQEVNMMHIVGITTVTSLDRDEVSEILLFYGHGFLFESAN